MVHIRFRFMGLLLSHEKAQLSSTPMKQNLEEISVYLGKNSFFEGRLTLEGVFRLDGKVKGEIFHKGTLIMSETAMIEGKVEVNTLILNGMVEGEVNAKERIEIHPRGRLLGNIFTPVLVIQDGGVFEGNCKMEKKPAHESDLEDAERQLSEATALDAPQKKSY